MRILNRRNVIVTALAAFGGALLFWRRRGSTPEHPTPA
jgi:hypothetical protein